MNLFLFGFSVTTTNRNCLTEAFRSLSLLTIVVLLCCFVAPCANGYDDDTHFWLTYYLARQVGYNRDQALQIASANVSVDYDKHTWPILPLTLHMQDQRKMLHALPSTKEAKRCRHNVERKWNKEQAGRTLERRVLEEGVYQCLEPLIEKEQQARWDESIRTGNPGVFLHYYQDRFAHRGFESRLGHLRAGHIPDFLSSDPAKAYEMAQGTIQQLRSFMAAYWQDRPLPPEPNWENDIKPLLKRLIDANDSKVKLETIYAFWDWNSTMVRTALVYSDESNPQPEKHSTDLIRLISKSNSLPSPNSYRAYEIVTQLYPNEVQQIWMYDLDKRGLPKKEAKATPYWYNSERTKLEPSGSTLVRVWSLAQ